MTKVPSSYCSHSNIWSLVVMFRLFLSAIYFDVIFGARTCYSSVLELYFIIQSLKLDMKLFIKSLNWFVPDVLIQRIKFVALNKHKHVSDSLPVDSHRLWSKQLDSLQSERLVVCVFFLALTLRTDSSLNCWSHAWRTVVCVAYLQRRFISSSSPARLAEEESVRPSAVAVREP